MRLTSGWPLLLQVPEMRMGREPVEPDPANTGGGIGMHLSLRAVGAIPLFRAVGAIPLFRAVGAIPLLFVVTVATAAGNDSSLDEVVVTAELRERSLQQLPASATVL